MICELEAIWKSFIPKLSDNGYGGQLITKALEYIAVHYTENLTLQSVADTVHLSKSYFSLVFKKQTGRNFIDYLVELRIREAKRLLAQTGSRIYDVAGAAGFKDVKYFSKVFKKATGLTPVEYRENKKLPFSQTD
ncbi:Bifunctional transcriptional activator/DNA repair enzyme AdaA [compost metagenome]